MPPRENHQLTRTLAQFIVGPHVLPHAAEEFLRSVGARLPGRNGPGHAGWDMLTRVCVTPLVGLAVETGLSATATRTAMAVGAETAVRLHNALTDHLKERGWDTYAGPALFGIAAGAARILGLSAAEAQRCLSIAATQVGGLTAAQPAWAEFQHEHAARSGIHAARLAAAGMTAPSDGLEGRRGLFAVMAPATRHEVILTGLGSRWNFAEQRGKYEC
ncbi:MmgE/PrpD family protein [Streptomyces spiralis]|uniref:MmgE/PrpD family protein n=1 Tax=Streptomyces spiralis TaxID=66376 RepID=UPI00367A5FFF